MNANESHPAIPISGALPPARSSQGRGAAPEARTLDGEDRRETLIEGGMGECRRTHLTARDARGIQKPPTRGLAGVDPETQPRWTPRALAADDMNSVLSGASEHRGRRPGPAVFWPAVTIKRIMSEALPACGVQRFPPCRRRHQTYHRHFESGHPDCPSRLAGPPLLRPPPHRSLGGRRTGMPTERWGGCQR